MLKLELGCGENKKPGYIGLDLNDYPGVDIVYDLDNYPWPIEDNSCIEIRAIQVVEHVRDLRLFFLEIARISAPGCRIHLETPHYSCANSWIDPTHLHHLSVFFADIFCKGYMSKEIGGLNVVSKKITFGSFFWTWPGRLVVLLLGQRTYERRFSWIFPASSIILGLIKK